MKRYAIYLLSDRQGRGYVGQTSRTVEFRTHQHQTIAARGDRRAVYRWLRELRVTGETVCVKTLDVCWSIEQANDAERHWITRCADAGVSLQNSSRGGQRAYGPEYGETISMAMKRPESRARKAAATARRHAQGFMPQESKDRMAAGQRASWTEERKAQARARWADPEWRTRTLANQKTAFARPEVKERLSVAQKVAKGTPANRERVGREAKERWKDPAHRVKAGRAISAAMSTPESIAERSARMKDTWATPEHRAKVAKGRGSVTDTPEGRARSREAVRQAWARRKVRESAA